MDLGHFYVHSCSASRSCWREHICYFLRLGLYVNNDVVFRKCGMIRLSLLFILRIFCKNYCFVLKGSIKKMQFFGYFSTLHLQLDQRETPVSQSLELDQRETPISASQV
jgi:hypothetical protein